MNWSFTHASLLIIMRATIFLLTGRSVNNCYHATISIPPSDLTTPLPLLGAFNELFTSRLNIDKFCVNLRKIKTWMLKTTRCTSPSLSREGLTKFAYKKLTTRTPWRTLCKLLMNISWKIRRKNSIFLDLLTFEVRFLQSTLSY